MNTFTTAEAAEYIGKVEATVRYHVYNSGRLKPKLVKGELVFTQEQLDRFIQEGPRKAGRKRRMT